MTPLAIDTSVVVPLLVESHSAHDHVVEWWAGREVRPTTHSLAESYSVLTRLPVDARLAPPDAARLLDERLGPALPLDPEVAARLPAVLALAGISGGATYDAMVGLTARQHGVELATRDSRALATYRALGVVSVVV